MNIKSKVISNKDINDLIKSFHVKEYEQWACRKLDEGDIVDNKSIRCSPLAMLKGVSFWLMGSLQFLLWKLFPYYNIILRVLSSSHIQYKLDLVPEWNGQTVHLSFMNSPAKLISLASYIGLAWIKRSKYGGLFQKFEKSFIKYLALSEDLQTTEAVRVLDITNFCIYFALSCTWFPKSEQNATPTGQQCCSFYYLSNPHLLFLLYQKWPLVSLVCGWLQVLSCWVHICFLHCCCWSSFTVFISILSPPWKRMIIS